MMTMNQRFVLVGVLCLMVTVCSSLAATLGDETIRVTQHTPSPRVKRDVGGTVGGARILSGQDFPERMEFTLHLAGQDLKLSLEKHASPADVTMRDEKGDIHVNLQDERLQYGIYQDVNAVSTMTIECWDTSDVCKLTGSFYTDGKKWILEPIENSPDKYSMKEAASDFKSDTVKGVNKGDTTGAPHVPGLFEELLEGVLHSEKARTAAETVGEDVTYSLKNHLRRKRSNPIFTTCNIIEVLVVVDSTIWQYFLDRNSNDADAAEVELRKYYLALIGQVDLRYKCLGTYGICLRVYLRQLTIEKNSGFAVPDTGNPPYMEVIPSLVNCGGKRLQYAPHLDLAICLTRQKFIWTNNSPDYRSFAFFGILCDVTLNAYHSLVSEDFHDDQDLLIAHALLFTFGIESDGIEGCDDDENYVASELNLPPFDPATKTNPWEFSTCTRSLLQQALASGSYWCLNQGGISVNELDSELQSRLLPGKIFDLEFQCEHSFGIGSQPCIGPGETSIIEADHICSLGVYCTVNSNCVNRTRVFNGSPCGCNKHCFKNQCVRIKNVTLGGACEGCCECEDPDAECDCDTKTCRCKDGFFADNGACVPSIPNGGNCSLTDSTCADRNAQCTDNTCQCIDGFIPVNGTCVSYKCLNDNCTDSAECGRIQGTCINGVCKCNDTSYADQNGVCQPRVPLGGNCSGNAVCEDDRAFCNPVTLQCECIPPTFDSNGGAADGMCIDPIPNGDNCSQSDSCADPNAQCTDNTCQCIDGFILVNGTCVSYKCLNDNCTDSAECGRVQGTCINGVCKCNDTSFADQNGVCQPRVPLGGNCSGNAVCEDDRAFCNTVTSQCECIPPTFDSNGGAAGGMCIDPIPNGGNCSQSDSCADPNAQCTDNTCQCAEGFIVVNGMCVSYKCLNDNCTDSAECGRVQGTCINGVCKCNDTSFADQNGVCQPRVPLGGNCSGNAVCEDDRAFCNPLTSLCECTPPTFDSNGGAADGMCIDPIPIDGNCTVGSSCADPNAVCIGTCQCGDGFSLVNGTCTLDNCPPGISDLGGSCQNDLNCVAPNSVCVNSTCVCSSDTVFNATRNICMVPNGYGCVMSEPNCIDPNAECKQGKECCEAVCQCADGYYRSGTDPCGGTCILQPIEGDACSTTDPCEDVCSNSTCTAGVCSGAAGLFESCKSAVSCSEYPAAKCVTYNSQGITPPAGSSGSDKICLCNDGDGYYQIEQFCFCNPFGNVTNPKC